MTASPILVAVPADVRSFENYDWHATPDTYLKALTRVAGAAPVIVPALSGEFDVDALLGRVDGLLMTGSASNVHPDRYAPDSEVWWDIAVAEVSGRSETIALREEYEREQAKQRFYY